MTIEQKCARCWSGAEVRCKACKGPTVDRDDEYNGLSGGGDYERFECINKECAEYTRTIYVELPD